MNDAYYYIAKIGWEIASPSGVFSLSLLALMLLIVFNKVRVAKYLAYLILPFFSIICFLPLGEWLFYSLEKHYPPNSLLPKRVDGIIVLGGSAVTASSKAWQQPQVRASAERELTFMALSRTYPNAKLVFSGGSPWMNGTTESEVADKIFKQQGIATSRITYETRSRNTRENAALSKEMVSPIASETWLLITSAFHMPRAQGIFCEQGWATVPVPVDYQTDANNLFRIQWKLSVNLRVLEFALREWLGLIVHYLLSSSDTLIPKPCN